MNGQEVLSLTTAAQNMHVFLRKSPLCRSHFFEWLKTVISSNACGTSTLKSPLLRAFFTPHVHQRLRKRPPGCTLDCGFKTAESPALRGFVAGAAGACDCGPLSCTKIERLSSLRKPSCKVRLFAQNRSREYLQKVTVTTLFPTVSHPAFQLLAQTAHARFHEQKRVHTHLRQQDRTQGLTRRNTGRFGWGRYHYPRSIPHVHEHPRAGCQNGKYCRYWVLVGGAPKERREPRDSDALMRVAVPRRRGPAGLRNLFSFLSKLRFSHSVLRAFRVCET